ncbi:hypothetical protein SASPL_100466 [Salvia splendens]|uniref:Early light-induced protein n=1 Tax=Salvia splendens TaxID=180675 RepID=A0A8X8YS70_SALSN|nr:hypothetical protein SASPL_100466 [Salvia splendens]
MNYVDAKISTPFVFFTFACTIYNSHANAVSTDFFDVLAFSGPGPERINGRLAMTGALLSVASLVPLFSGQTPESKAEAVMTSDAELWNGRLFAMLGLLALALTEYIKGGALVSL